jgi:hypothetical protein
VWICSNPMTPEGIAPGGCMNLLTQPTLTIQPGISGPNTSPTPRAAAATEAVPYVG